MPVDQSSRHKVSLMGSLGAFWTWANVLSLARLLLVFPITYLILTDGPLTWLFALIIVGIVTDFFDGQLARWSHTVSNWGKVLDPLADKVAAMLIVAALVVKGRLPVWLLGIILFRDLGIIVCATILARRIGEIVMSAWVGKLAVSSLALTCLAALLHVDPLALNVLVWLTAGLLVTSQVLYLVRFFRLLREASSARSSDSASSPRQRERAQQSAEHEASTL